MHKSLILFMALALSSIIAIGCGKKQAPPPEGEMTMPMSITVESAPTTNLITKTGIPVEAGTTIAESTAVEETTTPTSYAQPTTKDIQQALKNAGLYTGPIDGKTGPLTKKAIVQFQEQNGLTADGKVGRRTWEKLKTYISQG